MDENQIPTVEPLHYKTLSIGLSIRELEMLDAMVQTLKNRGFTKANRSSLIRFALSMIDVDKVPKGL
jgi:hypothetical protein